MSAAASRAQRPLEAGGVIRLCQRRSDLCAITAIIPARFGGHPCARDAAPLLCGPPVLLAPREHRPDEAGVLGCERHRGDVVPPPLLQRLRPAALRLRARAGELEHTACAVDQPRATLAIPALTDVAQARLPAAGIVPGDQPQPRRQLPALLPRLPIPHGRHHGGGRRGPTPSRGIRRGAASCWWARGAIRRSSLAIRASRSPSRSCHSALTSRVRPESPFAAASRTAGNTRRRRARPCGATSPSSASKPRL
jgi:hypothetical protein